MSDHRTKAKQRILFAFWIHMGIVLNDEQIDYELSQIPAFQYDDLVQTEYLEREQSELIAHEFGLRITGKAWPLTSSSEEYKAEFLRAFDEACKKHGFIRINTNIIQNNGDYNA